MHMHEGNIARHHMRPSEYAAWKNDWNRVNDNRAGFGAGLEIGHRFSRDWQRRDAVSEA
jgi:hypothetical protein